MTPELIQRIHDLHPTLDREGKWLYFENARTGTASINMAVGDRAIRFVDVRDEEWELAWARFKPTIAQAIIFTTVRHTWARVLSVFLYMQRCREIEKEYDFSAYITSVLPALAEDWNKDAGSLKKHFAPQIQSITTVEGAWYYKTEQLQERWPGLAAALGVHHVQLQHLNKTEHGDYWRYYDREARDIVEQVYEDEIELLNYRFGE